MNTYPIMIPNPCPHTHTYTSRVRGFSLLELMVVVSIMALLSAIAFPSMRSAMINAQMARSTHDVRSIVMGLRSWATDHDGVFPFGETPSGDEIATANDAFRLLIPYYIDNEKIFTVSRSAWGRQADNRIEDDAEILEPGENHYGYVAGLLDTSRSNWPLVADGTNGSGVYIEEVGRRGGAWEGRKAVVGYVGGSAAAVKLAGERGAEKFVPREGYPEENALDVEYMGEDVTFLDPAGG